MFVTIKKETIFKILGVIVFVGIVVFYLLLGMEKHPEASSSQGSSSQRDTSSGASMVTTGADPTVGPLILVNKECLLARVHEEGLVNLCDVKNQDYRLKDNSLRLEKTCAQALNQMLSDAKNQGKIDSLVVLSAYRTFAYQENLYTAELAQKGDEGKNWVAPPGGSEHHTGLCVDLAVGSKGQLVKISDDPVYTWIFENCQKYGFVLRYPKDKTEQTGYNYEPWHFRYVGPVHSQYIKEQNLCLEEYLQALDATSAEAPLSIQTESGAYICYRVLPAEDGTFSLPQNGELSGDNRGGMIVTIKK